MTTEAQFDEVLPDDASMESSSPNVTELLTVPRKFFEQLVEDSSLDHEFEVVTGAQVEAFSRDTQRQCCPDATSVFDGGHETVRPTQLHRNAHQRQSKTRREYLVRLTGTRSQANTGERTVLKIDVSFADHSFIIGRLGKGIQTVMRDTGTQVHFPDSNKNNQVEKSNQVSVTGAPNQVLEAHKKIRARLPVSFVFLVNKADYVRGTGQYDGNEEKIFVKLKKPFEALQNEHRMSINWLPVLGRCVMVTVRGARTNFERIREGLIRLMKLLQPDKPLAPVYLGIEVSPHYLSYVLGPGGIKIRYLRALTNTEFEIIATRDDRQYHIPTIRIYGQVDDVYRAWVCLMEMLPATLLIDVPEVSQTWHDACDDVKNESRDSGFVDAGAERSHQMELLRAAYVPWNAAGERGEACSTSGNSLEAGLKFPKDYTIYKPVIDVNTVDGVVEGMNDMLHDYDISLVLRLNRDPRQWRIVARGPEGYLDLLMDVYRALSKPDVNPIAYMREILRHARPPIRYGDPLALRAATRFANVGTKGPMSRPPLPPTLHDRDPEIIRESELTTGPLANHELQYQTQYAAFARTPHRSSSPVGDQHDAGRNLLHTNNPQTFSRYEQTTFFGGYDISDNPSTNPSSSNRYRSCSSILSLFCDQAMDRSAPPVSKTAGNSSEMNQANSIRAYGAVASPDGLRSFENLRVADETQSLAGKFQWTPSQSRASSDFWPPPMKTLDEPRTTPSPPLAHWLEAVGGPISSKQPRSDHTSSRRRRSSMQRRMSASRRLSNELAARIESLVRRFTPAEAAHELGIVDELLVKVRELATRIAEDRRESVVRGPCGLLWPNRQGAPRLDEAVRRDDWSNGIANLAPGAGRRAL
ncbi:hypothetical protein BIW11_02168 [Tropilaelaps mercedesae]|uniref:K Homology domain-containing protein n=1 Tax=Tropilaelaps mercedesae TaxID=418985 RepID=A0A1V9X1R3_9ACAR|nr:hypothetical protein BIW11_02168 [Tropilaelaps mercedesae]